MKRRADRSPRRSLAALLLPVLGLSALLIAGSCRQTKDVTPVGDDETQKHVIHSERLVGVMRGLQSMANERLPQELEVQSERERKIAHVKNVAKHMVSSARNLPKIMKEVNLPDDAKGKFLELATQLEQQSAALEGEASKLTIAQIRERVDTIRVTCSLCHSSFRELPDLQFDELD